MRLLVTGASGFVGRRLVAAARARWPAAALTALGGPDEEGGLDVTDPAAVRAVVAEARPSHVVHLAAIAAVVDAGRDPLAAFAVNLGGALHVVEALRSEAPEAMLLHVSSAEVYGRSLREARGRPVDEQALLQPVNVYAASKASADIVARAAGEQGLAVTVVRPFNHIGEGQSESFVVPAFAAQVARAEAGLQPPVIQVGGLEDARDFLCVEDVVDAYIRLLERGGRAVGAASPDVFNVASGAPVTIGDILERLLRHSRVALEVRVDPSRLRRESPAAYVGDAARLRRETGWAPACSVDDVLAAVLDEQRRLVAALT